MIIIAANEYRFSIASLANLLSIYQISTAKCNYMYLMLYLE